MPVQDLTPQLRTRLSRVERAVGWFVILATVLLLAGFTYYVYHTAQRKGWFLIKAPYHTFAQTADGLREGDAVKLMGFDVGQITKIEAMPPFSQWGNVYIELIVLEPYYGYIWTDSKVKISAADLLGKRSMELIQGGTSGEKVLHASYKVEHGKLVGVWDAKASNYIAVTKNPKGFDLGLALESPSVAVRLEELTSQAQQALPGILDLTNQVSRLLTNAAQLSARADTVLAETRPMLTNLAVASSLLTNRQGGLGDWLLPTNLNRQAQQTLASADATLTSANTNIARLATSLNQTLENLASITSNLNAQVQRNDQILSQISAAVTNADTFVQGLKHHWLLRSAFKNEQPSSEHPPSRIAPPAGTKRGHR